MIKNIFVAQYACDWNSGISDWVIQRC